jgi:hypothetical protein
MGPQKLYASRGARCHHSGKQFAILFGRKYENEDEQPIPRLPGEVGGITFPMERPRVIKKDMGSFDLVTCDMGSKFSP